MAMHRSTAGATPYTVHSREMTQFVNNYFESDVFNRSKTETEQNPRVSDRDTGIVEEKYPLTNLRQQEQEKHDVRVMRGFLLLLHSYSCAGLINKTVAKDWI